MAEGVSLAESMNYGRQLNVYSSHACCAEGVSDAHVRCAVARWSSNLGHFEHVFLARAKWWPLVEGQDLVARKGPRLHANNAGPERSFT